MAYHQKHDFQRDFLVLVGLAVLLLIATVSPAKKWLSWSSEQRAVENYVRAAISSKEEFEIVSWQPPKSLYKTPGVDRAIWCHYTTEMVRDKPRHTKAIFYFQDGRVKKVLRSDEATYAESYKRLWGEPKFQADILVVQAELRASDPERAGPKPGEPNWAEPSTNVRIDLCTRLIAHWQRKLNRNEVPPPETLKQYLESVPLTELVGLGYNGNCFLDRQILKREWEERGKTEPWSHPTFLKREDVLVSLGDKLPFVLRDEEITDLSGAVHISLVRESKGEEKKQPGGLPPIHLVWLGSRVSQERINLPGNPDLWTVAPHTLSPYESGGSLPPTNPQPPSTPTEPSLPQQQPVVGSPLKLLEFTARSVEGGLFQLKGKVVNKSDSPVENAWAKINTPVGPVSVAITPKTLPAGGVGTFSRNVRRTSSVVRYTVELIVAPTAP